MEPTVTEIRSRVIKGLTPKVGLDEARAMERIILEEVLMLTPAEALANPERRLPEFICAKIDGIIARVVAGEPLQYVLGCARFCGMDFKVTPAVLIPRPETEQLVDLVVDRVGSRSDLRVLDLGTGSGCIAVALSRALKFAEVTGVDISADALAVARANAENLKVKVALQQGDILNLGGLSGQWDVIVSNPPYVLQSEAAGMEAHVLEHEPHGALFVPDADPMRFYTPIIDYWKSHRVPGGILCFEINPLCASKFVGAEIIRDMFGKERFAVCS